MGRPIKLPEIPKGGTNHEGLTWEEWRATVRRVPASMAEESDWGCAWRNGEDPTDYAVAMRECRGEQTEENACEPK